MGTIEIHEPEVKQVKPGKASSGAAAVLPQTELVQGQHFPSGRCSPTACWSSEGAEKRKAFATTTSFIFNCMVIVVMLAVPLMFTEELPKAQLLTFLMAPPPPPPPPPPPAAAGSCGQADPNRPAEHRGTAHPHQNSHRKIQMIKEEEAPPPMASNGGVVGGVPGGIPGGQLGGVIGSVISSTANLSAVPKFVPVNSPAHPHFSAASPRDC